MHLALKVACREARLIMRSYQIDWLITLWHNATHVNSHLQSSSISNVIECLTSCDHVFPMLVDKACVHWKGMALEFKFNDSSVEVVFVLREEACVPVCFV